MTSEDFKAFKISRLSLSVLRFPVLRFFRKIKILMREIDVICSFHVCVFFQSRKTEPKTVHTIKIASNSAAVREDQQ